MKQTICSLIRDLQPLYADALVGEESAGMIREHLAECAPCREFYGKSEEPAAPEHPPEAEEAALLKRVQRSQRAVRWFTVGVSMLAAVWLHLNGSGLLSLLPVVMLVSFVLALLFREGHTTLLAAAVFPLLLTALQGDIAEGFWRGLLLFPNALAGVFAAWMLRRILQSRERALWKSLLQGGAALAAVFLVGAGFYSMRGNPIGYFEARTAAKEYAAEHYAGVLEIGETRYSSKDGGYNTIVYEAENRNHSSALSYYPGTGYLSDRYHFETQLNMSQDVEAALSILLQAGGIPPEAFTLRAEVGLPEEEFGYTMHALYDTDLPAAVDLCLEREYVSEETFAETAFQMGEILRGSGIRFERVEVYAYLADGNRSFRIENPQSYSSPEELERAVILAESEK
jgi:predicted anti-sigma-YlaC factor YlaD